MGQKLLQKNLPSFFPTCQVRVVRFYVSCLLLSSPPHLLLISSSSPPPPPRRPPPRRPPRRRPSSNCDPRSTPVGPQPRIVPFVSVPCRTSTSSSSTPSVPWTIHAQCLSTTTSAPSVPCRTSTASRYATFRRYAR